MGFWREVFSETDGHGSFGRTAFGFVIGVCMFCIAVIVYAIVFKERPIDLKMVLEGFAFFILAVGSTTYTANKISTLKWADKSVDNKPQ